VNLPGIVATARSLTYYWQRQRALASNLANISTSAYKAERVAAGTATAQPWPQARSALDLSQGRLLETGRPLDLALEGPGFLVIQSPRGERLTRGGSLQLDAQGRLTTLQGDVLLGQKGPITLPPGPLTIEPSGRILVAGTEVDTLRLVVPGDPAQLQPEGAGRFLAGAKLADRPPGTAVRQGMLEEANVDAADGLIELITVQRLYQASLQALRIQDGALDVAVNHTGRVAG